MWTLCCWPVSHNGGSYVLLLAVLRQYTTLRQYTRVLTQLLCGLLCAGGMGLSVPKYVFDMAKPGARTGRYVPKVVCGSSEAL
jgi:hypothetical protein